MFRKKSPTFSISISRSALESVFDECDRYNVDETGGRLLGTYQQKGVHLDIQVRGVLEPGPQAQRSPTYFLQDGDYQENLFRQIEANHPDIEHLGNWHTHHVNGLQTLSGGDKTTYHKTVNHAKHNTDFFYALLVVNKNARGTPRYGIKHFIFRRGDDSFYEVPPAQVSIVDAPPLDTRGPATVVEVSRLRTRDAAGAPNPQRTTDHQFFSEFYPTLKPLFSKTHNAPYWKGALSLIDGSHADIVAIEDPSGTDPSYAITASSKCTAAAEILEGYKEREFPSARHAVLALERDLNQAIYRGKKG